MGVATRALAFTVGSLLALGGTAMAAYVGPDDTLEIGTHTAPQSATGLAVATHPEITQFVGIDMLVRVSAPSGVWIGTSHRVDTESLLEGVRHYEISRMALNTVGGRMVEGDEAGTRRALRPQRLTGWRDQAYASPDADSTGTGDSDADPAAELVVPLAGTPTDVVAVPDRHDERITLTIGVHREGLFGVQCAVAGAGVLLILLGFLLSWRARRRSDGDSGVRPVPAAEPTSPEPPAPPPSAPEPPSEGPDPSFWDRPVRRLPTPVAVPLTLVVLLVLSSCSMPGPATAPTQADPADRVALTVDEARALGGAEPVAVHANTFTTYPMWAVTQLAEPRRLRLLTRESFRDRWVRVATVRVREVPDPVSPPRRPGAQVRRQAERAVEAVAGYWTTGVGIDVDRRTRRAQRAFAASGVDPASVWSVLDASYVVEVSGGWLVVASHTLAAPDVQALTTAVLLSDAPPRVLGSRLAPR